MAVLVTESALTGWGRRIGARVERPVLIALRGPLGAGKSVLARAVAEGAGVRECVPSPTFNLVFRYPLADGASVIHADLFRVGSPEELDGIGWDELVGDEAAIALVEWPERAGGRLPADRWDLTLDFADDAGLRRLAIARSGDPPRLPALMAAADPPGDACRRTERARPRRCDDASTITQPGASAPVRDPSKGREG